MIVASTSVNMKAFPSLALLLLLLLLLLQVCQTNKCGTHFDAYDGTAMLTKPNQTKRKAMT